MDKATILYGKIKAGYVLQPNTVMEFLSAFGDKKHETEQSDTKNASSQHESFAELANKTTNPKLVEIKKDAARIQALRDIIEVWEQEGKFLDHKDVFEKIINKKIDENVKDPYSNQEYKKFTKDMLDAAYDLDPVSGCYDKSSAPILEGLSHIYKKAFPQSDVIGVTSDIGNQTAANTKLGEELGDIKLGWKECDKAIGVSVNIYNQRLKEILGDKANFVFYRKGGDEFGATIQGNVSHKELNDAFSIVNAELEKFYHHTNLHDMPHPKYPNDPMKKGMSIGISYVYYEKLLPFEIQEEQEMREALDKLLKGYARKGKPHPVILKHMIGGIKAQNKKNESGRYPAEVYHEIKKEVHQKKYSFAKMAAENIKLVNEKMTSTELLNDLPDKWKKYLPKLVIPKKPPASTTKLADDRRARFENSLKTMEDNANLDFINKKCETNEFTKSLLHNLTKLYMAPDYASSAHPIRMLQADVERYDFDAKKGNDKQEASILYTEFGNLQSLNGFGHHIADIVLHHEVKIIKDTLKEYGIKNSDAVYTTGGGSFLTLLPSSVKMGEKEIPVDKKMIKNIQLRIQEKVEKEINQKNIYDYFTERGIPTEYAEASAITGILRMPSFDVNKLGEPIYNPETGKKMKFSDLQHPRRAGLKGISVVYTQDKNVFGSPDFTEKVTTMFKTNAGMAQDEAEQRFLANIAKGTGRA